MASDVDTVVAVRMPQPNVNDEEVTLVGWRVADGERAVEGEPLCEVETSKSVGDVPSPATGILKQTAGEGDVVTIGDVFAYVGPSLEAIEAHMASGTPGTAAQSSAPVNDTRGATAGALELARRHGIDVSEVPSTGRVRRSDIEQFIADRGLTAEQVSPKPTATTRPVDIPPALADRIEDAGELSDHERSIVDHLARTQQQLVVAHAAMDIRMSAAQAWMESKRQAGMMTGPLPVLLKAAAAAIAAEPRLASFRLGRRVFRYRGIDIAYTARSSEGRLFTPVVRDVAGRSLDDLATECGRLNMASFRGQLDSADMIGGCLTVSVLSDQPVRFHVGLQNAWQSALLTAGAVRDELALEDGQPVAVPTLTLVLSYDHGLMDGWQAAAALTAARTAIESRSI